MIDGAGALHRPLPRRRPETDHLPRRGRRADDDQARRRLRTHPRRRARRRARRQPRDAGRGRATVRRPARHHHDHDRRARAGAASASWPTRRPRSAEARELLAPRGRRRPRPRRRRRQPRHRRRSSAPWGATCASSARRCSSAAGTRRDEVEARPGAAALGGAPTRRARWRCAPARGRLIAVDAAAAPARHARRGARRGRRSRAPSGRACWCWSASAMATTTPIGRRRWPARCVDLRIFRDEEGRPTARSLDVGGAMLASASSRSSRDTRKGRRPSFIDAAPPELGDALVRALRGGRRGARRPRRARRLRRRDGGRARQRRTDDHLARYRVLSMGGPSLRVRLANRTERMRQRSWRMADHVSSARHVVMGGAPRSGTTLLRRIFDQHPGICAGARDEALRACGVQPRVAVRRLRASRSTSFGR